LFFHQDLIEVTDRFVQLLAEACGALRIRFAGIFADASGTAGTIGFLGTTGACRPARSSGLTCLTDLAGSTLCAAFVTVAGLAHAANAARQDDTATFTRAATLAVAVAVTAAVRTADARDFDSGDCRAAGGSTDGAAPRRPARRSAARQTTTRQSAACGAATS
jgi:hypothetical protein